MWAATYLPNAVSAVVLWYGGNLVLAKQVGRTRGCFLRRARSYPHRGPPATGAARGGAGCTGGWVVKPGGPAGRGCGARRWSKGGWGAHQRAPPRTCPTRCRLWYSGTGGTLCWPSRWAAVPSSHPPPPSPLGEEAALSPSTLSLSSPSSLSVGARGPPTCCLSSHPGGLGLPSPPCHTLLATISSHSTPPPPAAHAADVPWRPRVVHAVPGLAVLLLPGTCLGFKYQLDACLLAGHGRGRGGRRGKGADSCRAVGLYAQVGGGLAALLPPGTCVRGFFYI
jgi:hypothetical protein